MASPARYSKCTTVEAPSTSYAPEREPAMKWRSASTLLRCLAATNFALCRAKKKSSCADWTLIVLGLFLLAALVIFSTSDIAHHPAGCELDYWKRKCRLHRGSNKHYRNFLAVRHRTLVRQLSTTRLAVQNLGRTVQKTTTFKRGRLAQHAGLLMPPTVHASVTDGQLGEGRLLVVGDIHGCRDELLELLEKAKYVQGRDNLVLAGDLVEKGPYPIQVVREARRLGAMAVRGNHDDSGLAAAEALHRGEAVKSKHAWAEQLSSADEHWLGQLPWSISIPAYSLIVVHAGLVPEVALEDQLLVDLYRMRELGPGDDTRWHGLEANPDRGQGVPWARVWAGPQHVVFGHDHQRGLQDETYATGIDTGVAYGDYLTGVLFPDLSTLETLRASWRNATAGITLEMLGAEIIQVKAKRKYYAGQDSD